MAYIPDRGDWVWAQFNPQAGHEQAGQRPGLVLSPLAFNRATGLCIICPVTNTKRGLRTQVEIPAGQPLTGAVLADHIKSIDFRARKVKFIGKASATIVSDVIDIITSIIDP